MITFEQFDKNDLLPVLNWPAGQFEPQPAAIRIDSRTETVTATSIRYMTDATPGDVYYHHRLEFHIPNNITGRALNKIFEDAEFRHLCERIIDGYEIEFDGNNVIGVYSDDATAAINELEQWLEASITDVDCAQFLTADDFVYDHRDTFGITAETSNWWIHNEAQRICEELAADNWAIVGGAEALAEKMIEYRDHLKG